MGEHGEVAVSEIDEMSRRRISGRLAIGANGVESGRPGPAVDQDRRGQARAGRATLEIGHRIVGDRHDDEPVDAAVDQRLDPPALLRRILARGDDEKIVAVALGQRFDAMHETRRKTHWRCRGRPCRGDGWRRREGRSPRGPADSQAPRSPRAPWRGSPLRPDDCRSQHWRRSQPIRERAGPRPGWWALFPSLDRLPHGQLRSIGFERERATVSRCARRQESGGRPRRMRSASATVCRPIS